MASSPSYPSYPVFSEDYPYIVTRVVPGFYHVIPVPAELPEADLLVLAERQVVANKLQTCLVMAEDRGAYFQPRSTTPPVITNKIPRGNLGIADKLRGVPEVFYNPRCTERIAEMEQAFKARISSVGSAQIVMGDLSKGNRQATPEELQRLKGFRDRIPVGLELCETCGQYRGECLDPSPHFAGTIATVHCDCENDNLCAFCEKPLADSRLGANIFNTEDGHIWHLPGFAAFGHVCQS